MKWRLKNNIWLLKKGHQILGFVSTNKDIPFYAFGSPNQPGGYIAFDCKSIYDAQQTLLTYITP